jgi:hypothetical protein
MRISKTLNDATVNGEFFCNREWNFEHKNMKYLLGALSEADKMALVVIFHYVFSF